MFSKNSIRLLLVLVFAVAIFPTNSLLATNSPVGVENTAQNDELVTLNLSSGSNISTLDPALATDSASITAIQNLFLGLTDLDPYTNEIVPELATHWDVATDGLTWTFHLRDDVMWMHYDPETEIATEIRTVVAEDFEYAIKRACDPRHENYYGEVIARVIGGCDVINQSEPENVTDELVFGDTIQVSAVNDTTLEITLQHPAAYFLSMTTMSVMSAVPHETIEALGDDWTKPANIVTNGPYLLVENTDDVRRVFARNTAFLQFMWHGGNIDRVVYDVIEDGGTAFALYQDNMLDMAGIPATELMPVYESDVYGPQHQILDNAVFYFGFNLDIPPFDDVHVRRAFSAIIDRQEFIERMTLGRGLPMIHFSPPSVPYAPSIDTIGVGYAVDYAREQMALSAYPNCDGFPQINIFTYQGRGIWGEYWAELAMEQLGCDPTLFTVEPYDFDQLVRAASSDEFPNAWTLGWGVDYPDPHNWLHPLFSCESDNMVRRPCSQVDTLMEMAAIEQYSVRRTALYADIENALFGEEGEYPIAPIYVRAANFFARSWYSGPYETDGIYGGQHWDAYSIDMEDKLAARGE